MSFSKQVYYKSEFQLAFSQFSVSSWSEKRSRAELSWKSFSSSYVWLEPARLGLITIIYHKNHNRVLYKSYWKFWEAIICSVVELEWEDTKQINSESKVEGMNTYDMIQERTNVNKPMQSGWYLSYEQYTFEIWLLSLL